MAVERVTALLHSTVRIVYIYSPINVTKTLYYLLYSVSHSDATGDCW